MSMAHFSVLTEEPTARQKIDSYVSLKTVKNDAQKEQVQKRAHAILLSEQYSIFF